MPESYAGGEWIYIPETDLKYIPVVNDISLVNFAYLCMVRKAIKLTDK